MLLLSGADKAALWLRAYSGNGINVDEDRMELLDHPLVLDSAAASQGQALDQIRLWPALSD